MENDIKSKGAFIRVANGLTGDTVSIFLLGKGVELENLIQNSKDIDGEVSITI